MVPAQETKRKYDEAGPRKFPRVCLEKEKNISFLPSCVHFTWGRVSRGEENAPLLHFPPFFFLECEPAKLAVVSWPFGTAAELPTTSVTATARRRAENEGHCLGSARTNQPSASLMSPRRVRAEPRSRSAGGWHRPTGTSLRLPRRAHGAIIGGHSEAWNLSRGRRKSNSLHGLATRSR